MSGYSLLNNPVETKKISAMTHMRRAISPNSGWTKASRKVPWPNITDSTKEAPAQYNNESAIPEIRIFMGSIHEMI